MKRDSLKLTSFLFIIFFSIQLVLRMVTVNAAEIDWNKNIFENIFLNKDRVVKNIDDNWRFHKGTQGDKENFSEVEFNDSSWEIINLPHTWNVEDGSDGGNNYYRGDGWYRKVLKIPKNYKDKSLFLQFGAANMESEIFVNGKSLNTHLGGYSAFTIDISDYVNYGQNNIVAVRVNNAAKDAIPLSGDFTFWGGIYRSVNLVCTDKTHIDVQDYGSSGVYVFIPNDESIKEKAEVTVKVPMKVENKSFPVKVEAVIKNAEGKKVKSVELKSSEVSEDSDVFTGTMTVTNPHLWNGIKDPYLHTIEVSVARNGKIIDCVKQKVGFRYYSVEPHKGFLLNGKIYPLHGINSHQDRKGYGNAVPDKIRAEDFEIIKEIGANVIRLAHYPHTQFAYNKADEMGLVVWTEIPFVNEMTATDKFTNNTEKQLIEMIKQNYNHPCILTWGIQNELGGFGGYIPSSELSEEEQYDKATKLMQRLATKAKELDPGRWVSQAIMGIPSETKEFIPTANLHFNPNVVNQQLNWGLNEVTKDSYKKIDKFIDISSMNLYFGWYTSNIYDLDIGLSLLNETYPNTKLNFSEYGAGANPSQHQIIETNFQWKGLDDAYGKYHPEEYQSYLHEVSYSIIKKHPELASTHLWVMFDFGSDKRNEGNNPGINDKGLVTYDRQTKKDAFYFYKAQWNKKDPFVYITSRRYTERKERITPIKVYSNLDEVTLTVNGKDYGKGRLQQIGVFVWNDIEIKASDNVVVATAEKADGTTVTDNVSNWIVTY